MANNRKQRNAMTMRFNGEEYESLPRFFFL